MGREGATIVFIFRGGPRGSFTGTLVLYVYNVRDMLSHDQEQVFLFILSAYTTVSVLFLPVAVVHTHTHFLFIPLIAYM